MGQKSEGHTKIYLCVQVGYNFEIIIRVTATIIKPSRDNLLNTIFAFTDEKNMLYFGVLMLHNLLIFRVLAKKEDVTGCPEDAIGNIYNTTNIPFDFCFEILHFLCLKGKEEVESFFARHEGILRQWNLIV
jgi:hypothetical protein